MSGKGMNWGKGVWLIFGGFVVFILGCVAFASMQRYDLVTPDYYAQQIDYQSQIDKNARTALLTEQPTIEFRNGDRTLSVAFPATFDPAQTAGTIHLFRPSNSSWDRTVPIALDAAGAQIIPAEKLVRGYWKVKVDWQSNGESYYFEQPIVIE
jgi:nitrogen fixation protein FixH